MTDWKTPFEGQTLIAHISDLHFGSPEQQKCWGELKRFLIEDLAPLSLILVTGDIGDSPDHLVPDVRHELDDLAIKLGIEKLGIEPRFGYFVCPGNHDRHHEGNVGAASPSKKFDTIFGPKVIDPEHPTTKTLPPSGGWLVRLLGVDSSANADLFARGWVDEKVFPKLTNATEPGPWDLIILLIHHHVLSVRMLEKKRLHKVEDLANVMSLVNSGTLLDNLTKIPKPKDRADRLLLLHGHYHEPFWARYGALEDNRRDVYILGAGSATGKDAFGSCSLDRASFNLIGLGPDKDKVTFYVLHHNGTEWQFSKELPPLDPHADPTADSTVRGIPIRLN